MENFPQVMVLTGQYSLWAKWAPPQERSQLITIAASGNWDINLIYKYCPREYSAMAYCENESLYPSYSSLLNTCF